MNRKVSDRLILNLSLFLDNELSKVEMLEIEELLKYDSEVAQIFDSLKNTRKVLRNTPKIKRRRSFTLTPEHSKQAKRQSGILSGMRLVSTFSMLLLLVVFTQNMLSDWSPFSSSDAVMSNVESGAAEMEFMDSGDVLSVKAAATDMDTSTDSESAAPVADSDIDQVESEGEVAVCNADDDCNDTMSVMSTDDAFGVTERVTTPEGPAGGGDGGNDDADAAAEEIPAAEEGLDSDEGDEEQEVAGEDNIQEDASDAAIVVTEVAPEVVAVDEDVTEYTDEPAKADGNTVLLIILTLISVLSSGTYLFLRKKYH